MKSCLVVCQTLPSLIIGVAYVRGLTPDYVYKQLHEIGPSFLVYRFVSNECLYNLRNGARIVIPRCDTVTYGINSITYQGVKIYNNMPLHIKDTPEFHIFKQMLRTWKITCKCYQPSCLLCAMQNLF